MNQFLLSYVNTPDSTTDYDREFETIFSLMDFVLAKHPDFTSYQIIVVRS